MQLGNKNGKGYIRTIIGDGGVIDNIIQKYSDDTGQTGNYDGETVRQYCRIYQSLPADASAEEKKRALEPIILSVYHLVLSMVNSYQMHGISKDCLIQEGIASVIRSADKYDPSHPAKFSTFCRQGIFTALIRAHQNQGRTIRISVSLLEQYARFVFKRNSYFKNHGYYPADDELAAELGVTVKKLRDTFVKTAYCLSLQQQKGRRTIEDSVSSDEESELTISSVNKRRDRELLREQLEELLTELDEKEKTVIELRFGLRDGVCRTQPSISKKIGLSSQRVHQIEVKALNKLRHPSRVKKLLPFGMGTKR